MRDLLRFFVVIFSVTSVLKQVHTAKCRQRSKKTKDTAPSRAPPSFGGEEEEVERALVPLSVDNVLPKEMHVLTLRRKPHLVLGAQ